LKKSNWMLVAIAAMMACAGARADVFPKEALLKGDRKDVAGGHGTVYGEYAFTRDKALKDQAIKEVSWLRLMPGDSIGYHQHVTNEDVYVIISGEGVFKDKDGKDKPVKAGDVAIVRKGESHGIANSGKEPLVFVDVIAEQ
jgi:mannose-6-phosphate isomerase-like protein (cupin superfamily)